MTKIVEREGALVYHTLSLEPGSRDLKAEVERLWGEGGGVLLGHARDGVVWGSLESGTLRLAGDVFHEEVSVPFRWQTLLELRIFDDRRELRIWCQGAGFGGIELAEHFAPTPGSQGVSSGAGAIQMPSGPRTGGLRPQPFIAVQDQRYFLVGTDDEGPGRERDGFRLLHGLAGERHAPPMSRIGSKLPVRHYFKEDERGCLQLFEHRYHLPGEVV